MDTDKSLETSLRMWARLGHTFRKHAIKAADNGNDSAAIRYGKSAEACYWQATGECDTFNLGKYEP